MNTDQLIVFLHELSHVGTGMTPEHIRDLAQVAEQHTPTAEEVQEAATGIQHNKTIHLYTLHLAPPPEESSIPEENTSKEEHPSCTNPTQPNSSGF